MESEKDFFPGESRTEESAYRSERDENLEIKNSKIFEGESLKVSAELEKRVAEEKVKIEEAHIKIWGEYGKYENLRGFIHYITALEKVFAEAKIRNWDAQQSKEAIINVEIGLVAEESGIPADTFKKIYDDFKEAVEKGQIVEDEESGYSGSASSRSDRIRKAASFLLEKNKDNKGCIKFIKFVERVLIGFRDSSVEEDLDEIKEDLIRAEMGFLSSDGDPALKRLEEIYSEFVGFIEERESEKLSSK